MGRAGRALRRRRLGLMLAGLACCLWLGSTASARESGAIVSVEYLGAASVIYDEPPIPGHGGTPASIHLDADLTWKIVAHPSSDGALLWSITSLAGAVEVTGKDASGGKLGCTGRFLLNPKFAHFRSGVSRTVQGYAIDPPKGAPFNAIDDTATGNDPACAQKLWDTGDSSGWGRFQTYSKGVVSAVDWERAIAPSATFGAGSEVKHIDSTSVCDSGKGCQGVESHAGKFYGKVTLKIESGVIFNSRP